MIDDDPGLILPEDIERRNLNTQPIRLNDLKKILHADEDFYINYKNNGMRFIASDFVAYFILLALSLFFNYGTFFILNKYVNFKFTVEHIVAYFVAVVLLIFSIVFLIPSIKVIVNYILLNLKLNNRFIDDPRS